jgi:hypothetical protein
LWQSFLHSLKKIPAFIQNQSPLFNAISGTIAFIIIVATFILTFHIGGIGAAKGISQTPPLGTMLYSAITPGFCDDSGGTWTNFGAQMTCQGKQTEISNRSTSAHLAGTFLKVIPGQPTYPTDYVTEVDLQQVSTSYADFGIYFRNQPVNQMGTYTFLIHPDGSWGTYVYDNNPNGTPTLIKQGHFGVAHAFVHVDVAVIGDTFTFYENGHEVDNGNATDSTYTEGTVGIAVDHGGTILASNFALYTPSS